jgi:glutamyl-tRNA reductase
LATTTSDLAALCGWSINHRTHGLSGLAQLLANTRPVPDLHASLSARGIDSVVFPTCNRFEVYWRSQTAQDDAVVVGALGTTLGIDAGEVSERASYMEGDAAATHLFRVCSGLESLVMGEAEVLGQARAALQACPASGPFLAGVFRAAIRTGRAARAETAIGAGALSIASTAIQWLSTQARLADRRVMVVGAGDTARKVARHLRAVGVGGLVVANRTRDRAEAVLAPLGAEVIDWESLPDEIDGIDAIVSAVQAPQWILTLSQLQRRARPGRRPLFVIDLSMPPSIEPGELHGLIRIGLADLGERAQAHRRQREAEVPRVEAVIERELEWLRRWARRESSRPTDAGSSRAAERGA